MKVFITGGTGFVGLNIINALVDAGHEVTALTRAGSNISHLSRFPVKTVLGELTDRRALPRMLEGMDAVIHTAGITGCKKSELPQLLAVNADTTRDLCAASLEADVKRFVYTSTTSTIGSSGSKRDLADENTPLRGFRAANPYGISKQKAERHIREAADKGLSAVMLNPAEVIGPFDYNLQWGRIILAVAYNQLPFEPPGGASFCHAAEVGRAHVSALSQGRTGETYILAGANEPIRAYIEAIETLLGARADRPAGNYWLKYLKAWLNENAPGLMREQAAVEAYRMRVFGGHHYFSCAKAVAELNYQPRSLFEMVRDAIEWYQSSGMIPRRAA